MEMPTPMQAENAPAISPLRISHVEIRVRNLDESARFYTDLFGLVRISVDPPSEKVCQCVNPGSSDKRFGLVLAEGLPPGTQLAGVDHLALAVPTRADVRALYERARARNIPATQPRTFDGFYQTFVFDPNGYKIELVSTHDE